MIQYEVMLHGQGMEVAVVSYCTRVYIKSRHDNITGGQAARFVLLEEVARLT
jgi:hypothetical protein